MRNQPTEPPGIPVRFSHGGGGEPLGRQPSRETRSWRPGGCRHDGGRVYHEWDLPEQVAAKAAFAGDEGEPLPNSRYGPISTIGTNKTWSEALQEVVGADLHSLSEVEAMSVRALHTRVEVKDTATQRTRSVLQVSQERPLMRYGILVVGEIRGSDLRTEARNRH